MLFDIDPYKKPLEPKIFLSKPNRTIISKISERFNPIINFNLIQLNDLTFDIPYDIEINHVEVRNDNVDLIKERYLLKVVLGSHIEWFVITELSDDTNEEKDIKTVKAFSLGYQLNGKRIRGYQVESYNARQALEDILENTFWTIDYLDADFELTYRDFDFPNTSSLDCVYKIAETFGAIVEWDTVNKKISLRKQSLYGNNRGFKISYQQYLKSLTKKTNSDEMATRYTPEGKDGLTIETVNPTGQTYIENYSYFLYPFERDISNNVITHSDFMTDSLCHAILDYSELIEANGTTFSTLLASKNSLSSLRDAKEIEINTLKNEQALVTDTVVTQQSSDTMFFYKFVYNGTLQSNTTVLNPDYSYVNLIKVSNNSNITVTVDGVTKFPSSNNWFLLSKVDNVSSSVIAISGIGTGVDIYIQIANITQDEYNTSANEAVLIEKYSLEHKTEQVNAKQAEIDTVTASIATVDASILALRNTLSVENNFTEIELEELLSNFVIEKDFSDQNYTNPQTLYDDSLIAFEQIRKPQMIIDLDIVDFLTVVDEQHNWDKLVLGDYGTVEYEKINTKVTAQIIGFTHDYENSNISLKIANVKDASDENKKFENYMYDSIKTSTTVSLGSNKWNKTFDNLGVVSNIIKNFWNEITNDINIAANETVVFDRKGITIYDDQDPKKFLRATHGILGITDDGGLTYKHAITWHGIIGERIFGRIITGERVVVGDPDGILEIRGNKGVVTDSNAVEVMWFGLYDALNQKYGLKLENDLNQIFIDRDDGFKITRKEGASWVNKFYVDSLGSLFAEDLTAKRLIITNDLDIELLNANTNELNIAKFDNILLDSKLTSIEKVQVKVEIQRIQSEYSKLLAQATTYSLTSRDATVRITTTDFTTAYNALIAYVNPLLVDMDATTVVDRTVFTSKFKDYYDEVVNIINAINDSIKYSSLQLGALYNKVLIDATNGITITRSDDLSKISLNANDGIKIERYESSAWVKKFYVDITGSLWAEDMTAKRLIITNNSGEQLLNASSSEMNLSKFTNILLDSKLTSIEKVQVNVEYNRIQSEYTKLLAQANIYKNTTRNTDIVISTTAFTTAYNSLVAYVAPLLSNMDATTTVDRTVFIAKFKDYYDEAVNIINAINDSIKYSSLQLGTLYNNVLIEEENGITITRTDELVKTILNATDGISISRYVASAWVQKFYVDIDGVLHAEDLIAKRLILVDGDNELILDANSKIFRLDNLTVVGRLSADQIVTKVITADEGFISDLTVNHLKTLPIGTEGQWLNYIDIKDNIAQWVTAQQMTGSAVHSTNNFGELLYWTDSSRTSLTIEVTSYIAYEYDYDPHTKLKIWFNGSGQLAFPEMVWGEGDGVLPDSAKGIIVKHATDFQFKYFASNTEDLRMLSLQDDKVILQAENVPLEIIDLTKLIVNASSEININVNTVAIKITTGGLIRLEHSSGSYIEVGSDINYYAAGTHNFT